MEGPVVGDLVGTFVAARVTRWAGDGALIQTVSAVGVIGLPRLIRCLYDDVRRRGIVTDHEWNKAAAASVITHHVRQVYAGDSRAGHSPGSRDTPVPAVDQPAGRIGKTGGLAGGKSRGRAKPRHDLASAVSLVV